MKPRSAPLGRAAAAVLILCAAVPPAADSKPMERGTAVECVRDGVRKRIEVVAHPRPDRICEVWYADTKTGWTNKIMWYAERDRGFCHNRADGLVAMLARTRWVCDVIRKRKVVVDRTSEAERGRNHDTIQSVGDARNADLIPNPDEFGDTGGKPALIVPRPPGSPGGDTAAGELRNGPDQTGGDPSVIVPQPRR